MVCNKVSKDAIYELKLVYHKCYFSPWIIRKDLQDIVKNCLIEWFNIHYNCFTENTIQKNYKLVIKSFSMYYGPQRLIQSIKRKLDK